MYKGSLLIYDNSLTENYMINNDCAMWDLMNDLELSLTSGFKESMIEVDNDISYIIKSDPLS